MSLARRHRDRVLAAQTAASALDGGAAVAPAAAPPSPAGATNAAPADRAAAQIGLRLTHDLRRLKEIRSIDLKIAAKREMLPHYRDWIAGLIEADAGVGSGIAADVLPTCMVWMIDTGDYDNALDLAEFALRHHLEMPSRYERDVATIVVEEITAFLPDLKTHPDRLQVYLEGGQIAARRSATLSFPGANCSAQRQLTASGCWMCYTGTWRGTASDRRARSTAIGDWLLKVAFPETPTLLPLVAKAILAASRKFEQK